jgi:hypothetical protein
MVDEAKVNRATALRAEGKTYKEIQAIMKAEFGTEISTRVLGALPKPEKAPAAKKSTKKSSKPAKEEPGEGEEEGEDEPEPEAKPAAVPAAEASKDGPKKTFVIKGKKAKNYGEVLEGEGWAYNSEEKGYVKEAVEITATEREAIAGLDKDLKIEEIK